MVAGRIFILCALSLSGWAQTHRYMVFFKDKANTPHSLSQPSTFLSERSMARRAKAQVVVNQDDLPVTPGYVTQVRLAGASAFFTSRWMNGVLMEATPSVKASVALLPFVSSVEMVAPNPKLLGGRQGKFLKPTATNLTESTDVQLAMLGIDKMHEEGFNGEGVLIALCDSGFPGVNTTDPFQPTSRIVMTTDFITNSNNVYQFHDHGTIVFSAIAAQTAGFLGGAIKANYLLFATEDAFTEYRIEEYNWLFAAERADSAGADIIQSSLGYSLFDDPLMNYKITELNGSTAVISKAAGLARDRGIIVVTSAGNEGNQPWRYITPPADVDGILSVGAVNQSGLKLNFSSVGPASDGRIKPDVTALGIGVAVINPAGNQAAATGTSLSAPLITSLVAGLLQAYPKVKPSELVEAIKLSSSQASAPDNNLGFGIPGYAAVKNYLEAHRPDESIYLYPNPSTSTIWVTQKDLPQGPADIAMYNAQGKEIWSTSITVTWANNPLEISIGTLGVGLYLLKIRTSTMDKTIRFMKH